MESAEDAVAREMGWTALTAYGNLIGVLAQIARDTGVPAELIRGAIDELDAANEATIASVQGRQFVAQLLSTIRLTHGANTG